MEASRNNQSHVHGRSYISPERTTTSKVSVEIVAMRARCNRVNDATLDLLKGKLRNRVVFGGKYIYFYANLIEAAPRCCVHCIGENMEGTTRNIRIKDNP